MVSHCMSAGRGSFDATGGSVVAAIGLPPEGGSHGDHEAILNNSVRWTLNELSG